LASAGDVNIVTSNLTTKDHWEDDAPLDSLRAVQLGSSYYAWGSVLPGVFEPTAFETSAFQQEDYTGAYKGVLVDFNSERVAFNTMYNKIPTINVMTDHWTGEIMLIREGKVYWLDLSYGRPHEAYRWRSKIFEAPNRRNFEAMRVWFSAFWDTPVDQDPPTINPLELDPNMLGIVRVWADERLVYTRELRTSGEFFRLPSGFKATWWQVEIEARILLNNIEMATTAKELLNV
jgi:hypothetical protein